MDHQVQTGASAPLVVEFMGRPSEVFGQRLEIEIPAAGLELAALRRRLADSFAEQGGAILLQPFIRGGLGDSIAPDSAEVRPGQSVFFFSPFSGG